MLPFFPAGAGGGCGLLFSPFFAMETVGSGARGVRMGEAGSGEENPKTLAEREGRRGGGPDVITLGLGESNRTNGWTGGNTTGWAATHLK